MTTAVKTRKTTAPKSVRAIASTQSLSAFVKSICDVMRRSNCASALQYVPELTWILFLRILDAQEARAAEQAEVLGADFSPALRSPWRWQDWAAPWSDKADHPKTSDGRAQGWKRQELFAAGDGRLFDFINKELLPHLHALDVDPATRLPNPAASPKQRIIGRIMTAVERVRVDDEANLRDILDRVHEISIDDIDDTHFFTLSQVYEDLLLKMGEKNSDGGQFFTPREVIRAMVHTVNPALGQTVYDPCCGTGGFLTVAYEHMARKLGNAAASIDIEKLKHETFFGREKENLVFPIYFGNHTCYPFTTGISHQLIHVSMCEHGYVFIFQSRPQRNGVRIRFGIREIRKSVKIAQYDRGLVIREILRKFNSHGKRERMQANLLHFFIQIQYHRLIC